MAAKIAAMVACLMAATALACSGDSNEEPGPTSTPSAESTTETPAPEEPTVTPAPSPAATVSPSAGATTGIAVVDEVIEAVLAGDAAALEALYRLTEAPCTHAQGMGGPPKCFHHGSPSEGTLVEAFYHSACEGSWRTDIPWIVETLLSREPELYAVVLLNLDAPFWGEPYMPLPEYGVILTVGPVPGSTGSERPVGVLLGVEEEGGVTYEHHVCIGPPDFFLSPEASVAYGDNVELIFKGPAYYLPRPGAATAPAGNRSGDPALDAILTVIEAGDAVTLASRFAPRDVPCTWATGLGGPPKCEYAPGQPPEGTPVRAVPATSCEGHWLYDLAEPAEIAVERGLKLFAVLELEMAGPMWGETYMPEPDRELLFEWSTSDGRRYAYSLLTQGGKIVFLDGGCAATPEQQLDIGLARSVDYRVILRGPAYR